MEPVIIALSGCKGSGKNTISDYIKEHFQGSQILFPYIQEYAFADLLKEFCINVLGLEEIQCYGSDDEKNTPTPCSWENTPLHKERHGAMTGRDVMQIFGTESVRHWFGNVWAEATIRKIREVQPKIAIITDTRFVSEVETVLSQPNGYIIRLTRSLCEDSHVSETSLDNYNWDKERCFVLDNADLSIEQQNRYMNPILGQIGSECNL